MLVMMVAWVLKSWIGWILGREQCLWISTAIGGIAGVSIGLSRILFAGG